MMLLVVMMVHLVMVAANPMSTTISYIAPNEAGIDIQKKLDGTSGSP